jgi:Concanavalin A-like lectin/glucanases superfamily
VARRFQASGGYGITSNSAVFSQTGGNPFTVDCWINLNTFPGGSSSGAIFTITDASFAAHELPIYMFAHGTQQIQLGSYNGSTSYYAICDVVSSWTTNTWHHIAGIADGSTNFTIYFDGAAQPNAISFLGPTLSSTRTDLAYIAANAGTFPGNFQLDGSLANMVLRLNTILTVNEIAALVRGVQPSLIRPQTITGFWPMIVAAEDASHLEVDFSGNSNSAQLNGTTSIVPGPPINLYTPRSS